jgi:hypothetical protein
MQTMVESAVPHIFKMLARKEGKEIYVQNLPHTQLLLIMKPAAQMIPKPPNNHLL